MTAKLHIERFFMIGAPEKTNTTTSTPESAFYTRSPLKIRYAQQPPRIKNKWIDLNIEAFAKANHFKWTDGLWVPSHLRAFVFVNDEYPISAISVVEDRLHHPLEGLMVCEMDQIGKGLFLSLEAKPLPIGTVVGIYAGRLEEQTSHNDYLMAATTTEHESAITDTLLNPGFNAIDQGNFTRFIQDAPTERELSKVRNLTRVQFENVATANLFAMSATHYGFPITYFVTVREIQPGEELTFSYEWSDQKWERKGGRAVRDINGNIIGRFKTPEKILLNDSFVASEDKKAPRSDPHAFAPYYLALSNPKVDTFNNQLSFINNVNHCFEVFLARPLSGPERQIMLLLHKSFNLAANDLKSNVLTEGLSYLPELMQIELLSYINKFLTYNLGPVLIHSLDNIFVSQFEKMKIGKTTVPQSPAKPAAPEQPKPVMKK